MKAAVYQSARAAITKYHRLDCLNNKHLFLTVLEAGSPRSRCWQGWFLLWPLSLACRWPSSCSVLSSVCPSLWGASLVSLPLLIRTQSYGDQGHTLMISFNLNYLFKSPISKYSHIGGQGFNIRIFQETQFSSLQAKGENKDQMLLNGLIIKSALPCPYQEQLADLVDQKATALCFFTEGRGYDSLHLFCQLRYVGLAS